MLYHLFSVDTGFFYTDKERELSEEMNVLYYKRTEMRKNKEDLKDLNKELKEKKEIFKELLSSFEGIRELTQEIRDKDVISSFSGSSSRIMGIGDYTLTDEVIIVQAYYFEVLEQIIKKGFLYKGERYICLTASAGQIRLKKTMFIKESTYRKHEMTFTCGLDWNTINQKGGVNINKYLAYLGLINSATKEWKEFNVRKVVVVDDFETLVEGFVDFIDEKTYEIQENVKKSLPIPHMDGCGLILPKIKFCRDGFFSDTSRMVRAPWVKGLLVPFNFREFIIEMSETYPNCGIIKDIYGKEVDIIKEDIRVIMTKSQFKMYKYYDSWEEYCDKYEKYGCQTGYCNEEPSKIPNAKLNYQMLQTLCDMDDVALKALSKKTNKKLKNIYTDLDTIFEVFKADMDNLTGIQKIVKEYPEIIQDTYFKETLRNIKKKIRNGAYAGKLMIDGKYTFLIPDLYAFCEWLFLGIEKPKGLLKDGEVSCSLYKEGAKLDVLRSPHLYREHAVRKNVFDKNIKKYFITKGIYTSSHDFISRILQFDKLCRVL